MMSYGKFTAMLAMAGVSTGGGPSAITGTSGNLTRIVASGTGVEDSGYKVGNDIYDLPDILTVIEIVNYFITLIPSLPDADFSTVANDTLSGLAARDGYTPQVGKICLVKNQTNQANNGFWIAAAGAWTRAAFIAGVDPAPDSWAAVTTQTTYAQLAYDNGVVNVLNGTVNRNLQYQVSIDKTEAPVGDAAVKVTVSASTRLPVGDGFSLYVNRNRGNDTNNSGNPAFPFSSITKALSVAQYPCLISVAPSGGVYSDDATIPAVGTNITFAGVDPATRGGKVSYSGKFVANYVATNPLLTWRGFTFTNATPFVIAGGVSGAHEIENCSFAGSMADITPTPAGFSGTLTIRNINTAGAPLASIPVKSEFGNFNFHSQTSPVVMSLAGAAKGANATISIAATCNAGCVWVPLEFRGTVNRAQPVPTRITSVITSQTDLNNLLIDNSPALSGFYLLSGFVPTQNPNLQGAIIGHFAYAGFAYNWWERSFADSPAEIAVELGGKTYSKVSAFLSWQAVVPSLSTGTFLAWSNDVASPLAGWPTNATLAGNAAVVSNYVQLTGGVGQGGTAIWNLTDVDWSRDITVEMNVFLDAVADGVSFNFGGSSAMLVQAGNTRSNDNNGGVAVSLYTFSTNRRITVAQNGILIKNTALGGAYPAGWLNIKFRIRNWGSRRNLYVYVNDALYITANISTWTPAGGYFSIGGGTGGAGTVHAVASVEARYV